MTHTIGADEQADMTIVQLTEVNVLADTIIAQLIGADGPPAAGERNRQAEIEAAATVAAVPEAVETEVAMQAVAGERRQRRGILS